MVLSHFSLSFALFLTRAIIWVSLSLYSQLFFFAPSVLSLSLSLLFARIIRGEDKESNFASTRRQTNQRKKKEKEKN
jgi:hypothetical protein